jgi:hypothetical protein
MSWKTKRTKPYLAETIHRQPCIRCGKPSVFQWQICSDTRYYRPICIECDMALNAMLLVWFNHPDPKGAMEAYKRKLLNAV